MANFLGTWKLVLILAAGGVAAAQKYVPPPPPLTVDPCAVQRNPQIPAASDPQGKVPVCPPPAPAGAHQGTPASGPPSAAEEFPFPGSDSIRSTPAAGQPQAVPAKPGSAGDRFPYPGETTGSPDAVPEGDTPKYVPETGDAAGKTQVPETSSGSDSSSSSSSSSGSSSSSSGSDSVPGGVDEARRADDGADAAPVRSRRHLPKVSAQSNDDRVAEDLSVAKFYSERGNFEAAYLRSKDATKAMPNDAESHFALAQAAEKLRKKEEAAAEYLLYLKLDPAGERIEAAQKALAGLR